MVKRVLIILTAALLTRPSAAQTNQNGGWIFLTHTQKISNKFDLLADAQLRTADRYKYLNTLLLRAALSYNLNKQHAVALGYAYKADWIREENQPAFIHENRIYEQYLYKFKLRRTQFVLRTRLEQRFVNEPNLNFSQRARLLLSMQLPLIADTAFTRGLYIGLQNEVFVNVQNKQKVNGYFFDQNRPFASLGYRFSKHIDTEAGYLQWFQTERDGDYRRHIFQLMITTNF